MKCTYCSDEASYMHPIGYAHSAPIYEARCVIHKDGLSDVVAVEGNRW